MVDLAVAMLRRFSEEPKIGACGTRYVFGGAEPSRPGSTGCPSRG